MQTIKATGCTVGEAADGGVTFTVLSNKEPVTIEFTRERWGELGATAQWFEKAVDREDQRKRLVEERDQAIAAAGELRSEVKRLQDRITLMVKEIEDNTTLEQTEETDEA